MAGELACIVDDCRADEEEAASDAVLLRGVRKLKKPGVTNSSGTKTQKPETKSLTTKRRSIHI